MYAVSAVYPVLGAGELKTGWFGIAVIVLVLIARLVTLMRRRGTGNARPGNLDTSLAYAQ